MIGLLGILKAGGAYVPLDPAYPKDRQAHMLADSNAPVLLTQESLLGQIPSCSAGILCLDRDWSQVARESVENLPHVASPGHPAYVIYTSGSTGKPKGVVVSHENVVRLFTATQHWFGFGEQRRLDAVPLVRVRLLGVGAVGRAALRRPARGRARTW